MKLAHKTQGGKIVARKNDQNQCALACASRASVIDAGATDTAGAPVWSAVARSRRFGTATPLWLNVGNRNGLSCFTAQRH